MNVIPALAAAHHLKGPPIDWASFSPIVALSAGALVVLLVGLLPGRFVRERIVPLLTIAALGATIGLEIWRLNHPATIIHGALRIDGLAIVLDLVFCVAALACVVLSLPSRAPSSAGHGEYHSLLLFSVLGMTVLVSAQDLVTLFIGFELLSIPLYILCAAEFRREGSLESGLKYLVIGSVGSATLVYGLALIYGSTGQTGFLQIANAISQGQIAGGLLGDPMLLTGLGLIIVGFAFKASVAPFHQWTPDVYEGAPTPITAFMATATKAAALGVILRFFDVAVIDAQDTWAPAFAAIATITIIVGNVGALGQSSLKRMLGYSSVAQAGYMLAGVVVGTQLGVDATVLYLIVYLFMNIAAFAVIVSQQGERADGDQMSGHLGARSAQPVARVVDDDRDAVPGRDPRHGRLHREVSADPRAGERRLHVARGRARDRVDDLARVLPAGRRRDLDERDGPGARPRHGGDARRVGADRRRLAGGRRAGCGWRRWQRWQRWRSWRWRRWRRWRRQGARAPEPV